MMNFSSMNHSFINLVRDIDCISMHASCVLAVGEHNIRIFFKDSI